MKGLTLKAIRIAYTALVELNLEEVCNTLGIDSSDIDSITTTDNVVTMTMNDGSSHIYEFDDLMIGEDIDTANPTTTVS
jgi:hypothetical protein